MVNAGESNLWLGDRSKRQDTSLLPSQAAMAFAGPALRSTCGGCVTSMEHYQLTLDGMHLESAQEPGNSTM